MQSELKPFGKFPISPFPMLKFEISESKIGSFKAPVVQHWLKGGTDSKTAVNVESSALL